MIDKLTESVSFKVSPRIKDELQSIALSKGFFNISDLCRTWVIEKVHESRFRMKDYINNFEEEQDK